MQLKDKDHYLVYIKNLYKIEPLIEIWDNYGSPSIYTGYCMQACRDWLETVQDNYSLINYQNFADYYLEKTRTPQQLYELAENLKMRFEKEKDHFKGLEKEILNIDNIFDLILFHSIHETFNGKTKEIVFKKHMEETGRKMFSDIKIDKDYGVDFYTKIEDGPGNEGFQVKPTSFLFCNKGTCPDDRNSVFTKFENLKKSEYNHDIRILRFAFYNSHSDTKRFLKFRNKSDGTEEEYPSFKNIDEMNEFIYKLRRGKIEQIEVDWDK